MNKLNTLLIALGLLIGNALLGHFVPPLSIFTLPVILLIVFLISRSHFQLYSKIALTITALIANDISVKLTTGGFHDSEGQGWINLFFIITVIISTIIVFSISISKDRLHWLYTTFLILIIPISLWIYLSYFDSLGLTYSKNESPTKQVAITNKIFLKDLQFSDNIINNNFDDVVILSGWAEKQVITNHQHLIKKYDDSSELNYIIKLKGNKDFKNLNINWNVNDTSINGSSPVDSIISFSCPKSASTVAITFFKMTNNINNDKIIKTVAIH